MSTDFKKASTAYLNKRIWTPTIELLFPKLVEPEGTPFDKTDLRYRLTGVFAQDAEDIPEESKAWLDSIDKMIEADSAAAKVLAKGKDVAKLTSEYRGQLIASFKSKTQPKVYDASKSPIDPALVKNSSRGAVLCSVYVSCVQGTAYVRASMLGVILIAGPSAMAITQTDLDSFELPNADDLA